MGGVCVCLVSKHMVPIQKNNVVGQVKGGRGKGEGTRVRMGVGKEI